MNHRERILAVLKGEEVDRIPWSLCMNEYYTDSLPLQGYHMDLIETLRFFRNDIMERHVPIVKEYYKNVSIEVKKYRDTALTEYTTPVGTLTVEQTDAGNTKYISKYLLNNIEDVKIYQYIVENTQYSPCYKEFLERDAFIGRDGIATPSGNLTPVQRLMQTLMGIQNFVYLMEDYPDEMNSLLQAMHECNKISYQLMAESPSPVVFTYEDTSTTVMSKDMYLKYSAPQLDDYADILHKCGKTFIVHMCGKLKGFADIIKEGKMDGIDSLCPPTTGDLWAHEARNVWGEGKIIIGGLEPPALVRMTVEETIRYTVDVLNRIVPGRAFVLSSGDAVSYGTPVENLLAITRVIELAGKFPLNGSIDPDIMVKEIISK